jgi:hypothetical protein
MKNFGVSIADDLYMSLCDTLLIHYYLLLITFLFSKEKQKDSVLIKQDEVCKTTLRGTTRIFAQRANTLRSL